MLINVPQILLHANIDGKNDPVNTVDFHPTHSILASGGSGEKRLLLWVVRQVYSPFSQSAKLTRGDYRWDLNLNSKLKLPMVTSMQ